MAKPSSAHNDSGAPTRRTRSQSAEAVEPPRPTSRGGRATQKAPSASAPVAGAKKRGRRTQKATPDLTTVEEDGDLEEQQENEDRLSVPAAGIVREFEEPRRLSAAVSVISGTTAKTSFSQEEVEQMDADVIADSLPSLAGAFDDLARIIVPAGKSTPPETWKEIRRPGSRHNKLYSNRLKSIEAHKQNFGTQEYIQPRIVLKALFGASDIFDLPDAQWRPDHIILKINLIQMMKNLLVEIREPGERVAHHVNALEGLLIAFPDTIAGQQYSLPAMEMYANIAAHVAIAKLEASVDTDPNFSPHHTIDTVFFDEDDTFVHAAGLGLNDTTNASRKQGVKIITDLVGLLKAAFEDDQGRGATAAIGRLKSQFRWDTLKEHSLRFYEGRSSQLAERITDDGGIDEILRGLNEEVERRVAAKEAEDLRRKYAKPGSTQRKSLGSGSMASLKERERLMAEKTTSMLAPKPIQKTAPPSTTPAPMDVPSDMEVEPTIFQDALPTQPVQASTQTTTSVASGFAQALRKNQRARLTDPQPNATRIDPNMDDEGFAPGRERTPATQPQLEIPGSSRSGKRPRADTDDEEETFDPTQDEGFQTDTRDFSVPDQRRREVQFEQIQRLPQRQHSVGAPGPSNYRSSAVPESSPAKRQRKNPGSSMPDPLPQQSSRDDDALPQSSKFERARTMAAQNRVVDVNRKPVQQRSKWSQPEENQLIDLIQEYGEGGISYAALKTYDQSEGNILERRTAEDLRFKARNMKVTFLRAFRTPSELPKNFDQIVLGKKEIELLERHGVRYQQERIRAPPVDYKD